MWLRWTLVVSLVLLLGTNLAWAHRLLDFGVTYTYLDGEYESCTHHSEQLSEITLRLSSSYKKADLLDLISEASSGESSFEKDGAIWVGALGFVFVGDRLSQIVLDHDAYLRSMTQ